VLFNLTRRGIELGHRALRKVAERLGATPAQVALAWVLAHPDVCAIPKAGRVEHVVENHGALQLRLTKEDMAELDTAFPPPRKKVPLEML
jgi:diketogulonate reductase-like aldo/keto reductase